MGLPLLVSTATNVLIGPFVDATDGNTIEAALTIEDSDILLSKNGGALTAKNDVTNASYDTKGYYICPLNATDTNTLGRLQLCVHMAEARPVYHEYTIVSKIETTSSDIWDEVITVPNHDIVNSAADYLRGLWRTIVTTVDEAQGGTSDSITLAATEPTTNDHYKGQIIAVFGGTGEGQARACYAYNGTTKVASIRPEWATNPDNSSEYAILNFGSSVVAKMEDLAVDNIYDEIMEGTITCREAVNIMLAVLAGKSSGGGSSTIRFRDQADTKDRVTATVTDTGDRTGIVNDGA